MYIIKTFQLYKNEETYRRKFLRFPQSWHLNAWKRQLAGLEIPMAFKFSEVLTYAFTPPLTCFNLCLNVLSRSHPDPPYQCRNSTYSQEETVYPGQDNSTDKRINQQEYSKQYCQKPKYGRSESPSLKSPSES
jgi:hypothetical protein